MNIYWFAPCLKYRLGIFFILGLIGIVPLPGMAQITPDETLGNERSRVNRNVQVRGGNADRIEGGASRGANLFHSFSEFNVNEGQRVYFANPSGIDNILSRVTGRDVSDIMGTLGVDGGANLFLLNPNGIIFGPNARLDISGSFVSSTADSFTFLDGTLFSATNPGDSSLLSVTVPLGVQYGPARGDITNAGNLAVNPGQTLTLYGGTVISSGSLTAPGGTVQVLGDRVALTENARIDVSSETGGGTVLVGGDYRGQGTTPSALRTYVGSGVVINADARTSGNGGRVIVWADEATGFYGTLTARGGANAGNGGFAEISSRTSLDFSGRADLSASRGQFGTLLLDPTNIRVVVGPSNQSDLPSGGGNALLFEDKPGENSIVNNGTIDAQKADVTLKAENNITFDAPISLSTLGVGLTAEARNNLFVNSVDSPNTILTNNGEIDLRAGSRMRINGGISSRGGNILLRAEDRIIISPAGRRAAPVVQTTGESRDPSDSIMPTRIPSGNLTIDTRELIVRNGGQVSVDTTDTTSPSNGGILRINSADSVVVTGVDSVLTSQVRPFRDNGNLTPTVGNGGNLVINTQRLEIRNGGLVTASTFSEGNAGDIKIQNADLVEVSDLATDPQGNLIRNADDDPVSSILSSQVQEGATGEGGDLIINAGIFRISNGGLVTVSTFSEGDAGDIKIQNADLVEVSDLATDSQGNLIRNADGNSVSSILRSQVQEGATGEGGDLIINAGIFRISNGGLVTASTFSEGKAGDIEIQNADLVEVSGEDSILRSQAEPGARGDGGDLTIDTGTLRISGGGLVTASTFSEGKAGDIEIQNADLVEVSGEDSILRTQVGFDPNQPTPTTGNGGNLRINTEELRISNGGVVTASTVGEGNAGRVNIMANDSVRLTEGGEISAQAFVDKIDGRRSVERPEDLGEAGSVRITTDALGLQENSRITVSNEDGVAGNLNIHAGSVTLDNSRLEATTAGDNREEDEAGNITITSSGTLLRLQNDTQEDGLISAQALGSASGGNVTLNVENGFVLANPFENSDIQADALVGNGGRIEINTNAIFGLEERDSDTRYSDIFATGGFNGQEGEIILNTLNIDPTRGLGELETEIVDAASLVAEGCVGSNRSGVETQGEFTRSGRGGLSPDPAGTLTDDSLIDQSAPADTADPSSAVPSDSSEANQPIVEAQGLARNVSGKVSLVPGSSNSTVPSPVFAPNTCDDP